MFRMSFATVFLLLSTVSTGIAQPTKDIPKKDKAGEKAKPITAAERQFLLYALENLSLQLPEELTLPSAKAGRSLARRSNLPTDGLRVFVKQQELVFDSLRRHIERASDKELEGILSLYRKQLDEYVEFERKVQEVMADYHKNVAIRQQDANSKVMLSGLGYALQAIAEGDESDEVISRSVAAMFKTGLEEGQQLGAYTAEQRQLYEKNYQAVSDQYKQKIKAARLEFDQSRKALMKDSKAEGTNPFQIVARAQAVLKKPEGTWKEMLEQAELCRGAVKMVPAGDAYDLYRAAFLGVGGVLANSAAMKDCGATGIPLKAKDIPKAGEVAREIWSAYYNVERKRANREDFADDFFQKNILAHAYAGAATDFRKHNTLLAILTNPAAIVQSSRVVKGANGVMVTNYTLRKAFSSRPDFWFDCARIASILGDTSLSLECLKLAVGTGFKDAIEAKANLELRNVREDPRTLTQFNKFFP